VSPTEFESSDNHQIGASEIKPLSFGTSRLREVRDEARRLAVAAVFDKTTNFCDAV
jgi:hypothetical protein